MQKLITALAGGVGAARFLTGLTKIINPKDLTVIVNTGDDKEFFGLHVSPDVDIVTYTLAGIADEQKGWGIKGDTFETLAMLKRYGQDTWFNLGDRDLATNILRTKMLKNGLTLTQATEKIHTSLGVQTKILPMTNDWVETRIKTDSGTIHFQDYMVKNGAKQEVLGVEFAGSKTAKPASGVLEAIEESDLVIICPSNPIVSIGTILGLTGVRDAVKQTKAKKIAISPIVAGAPIKGPADKLLRGLGFEVSALGVAELYRDFLDVFVIDSLDAKEKSRIELLGVTVKVTNTLMKSLDDKIALAKATLHE
ncbi:MAG: 2-phospho-L-lactate transferase [Candidatus Bathyarchaeota archaeon]|nr:2-phospho-L-lactate transferase [Candidatus Bathyarchaeota archaeon]